MTYLTMEQAAGKASVPLERVMHLAELGLLETVRKGNLMFLSSREEYKLRFILYLQREYRLRLPEIETILKENNPPYTNWNRLAGEASQIRQPLQDRRETGRKTA